MKFWMKTVSVLPVVAFSLVALTPEARAQQAPEPVPAPAGVDVSVEVAPEANAEISAEELTAFAHAHHAIQAAAGSSADAAQSGAAMEAALTESGLTAERYQEISALIDADAALQARLTAIMEEERASGDGN